MLVALESLISQSRFEQSPRAPATKTSGLSVGRLCVWDMKGIERVESEAEVRSFDRTDGRTPGGARSRWSED